MLNFRSGKEGYYPELVEFTEKKLQEIHPKRFVFRKQILTYNLPTFKHPKSSGPSSMCENIFYLYHSSANRNNAFSSSDVLRIDKPAPSMKDLDADEQKSVTEDLMVK